MPYFIHTTCIKCGACKSECPMEAIIEGPQQYFIDTDLCADHISCVSVCPVEAIFQFGKNPEEVKNTKEK